jgi:hypothetical protein
VAMRRSRSCSICSGTGVQHLHAWSRNSGYGPILLIDEPEASWDHPFPS